MESIVYSGIGVMGGGGIESGSSTKAARALNHSAISPGQEKTFKKASQI